MAEIVLGLASSHTPQMSTLIRTVGADRCLIGSEKPGTGSVRDPATGRWYDDIRLLIDEIDWLPDADRARLSEGNAAALFGLAGLRATNPREAG